jgi:putative ABC transport system permease protein
MNLLHLLTACLALVYLGLFAGLLTSDKGRRILVLALRSLWLHKLRAFLSVLGIIIGTGAVIALMAFGEGSMHDALEDIRRQGATNIIIRSVKPPDDASTQRRSYIATYGLNYDDYERFLTIPVVTRGVPMRIFSTQVRRLEWTHNGRVVATTPAYTEVNQLSLASGRFLSEDDDRQMINVAVLAANVADRLFPFEDPIGQTVSMGTHFYRVVGVIKERMPTGGAGGSQAAEDFNNDIYIPLQTCVGRFGEKIFTRQSGSRSGEDVDLHQITLTIADPDKVRPAGQVVREMLESASAHKQKKDWSVTIPLDLLEVAERAKERFNNLLVLIASISLMVGGIGIMNIMLATVTERTREIGIRRALGAKRSDITRQFLVEAVVQTSIGGLLGVVLGLGSVWAIPWIVTQMATWGWLTATPLPARVHVESIFLSLTVSVSVGVLFGWYPSRRAALLDPIEALRHE